VVRVRNEDGLIHGMYNRVSNASAVYVMTSTTDVTEKSVGTLLRPIGGGDGPNWEYESLVDVVFDHRPDSMSHGHFADPFYLTIIGKEVIR